MNLLEAIELHLPRGFAIQEQLGIGGTSFVYLAHSESSDERIVVKVMRPGTVTDDAVDRFLREMRILKTLSHPRIVPMLEPGEANGAVFFTMPYIDGHTLRVRLQAGGALPVRDALLIARDLADALGHVHGNGFVHRDVKPDNVLLAHDGAAYLIDFGFASAPSLVTSEYAAREARMVIGTPGYMSPEKLGGKRAEDWRSDFFSLGCVMYEMLTGSAPFPSSSPRAATARAAAPPPDARQLRPELPEDVAAIVRRSLEPDPSSRYATAGFLRTALDGAIGQLDAAHEK